MKVLFRGKPHWPNEEEIPEGKRCYKDEMGNHYVELADGTKHSVNATLDNDVCDIHDVRWTIHPERDG